MARRPKQRVVTRRDDPLAPTADRVGMMIGRAVLAGVKDDTGVQELQLELLHDETHDAVEHFQPYGFTAHPKAGAEGIMLAVGGLRSHGLAIAVGDRRFRLKSFAEGEVAIHDDQGQKVHLTRDGIVIVGKSITVTTEGDVSVSAEGDVSLSAEGDITLSAKGDLTLSASGSIALDSDDVTIGNGATLDAARKTDAVSASAITAGSSKVKIA